MDCRGQTARLLTRGLGVEIARLPTTVVRWAYAADTVGQASVDVEVSQASPACATAIAACEPWEVELVVEDPSEGRVWSGPVVDVSEPEDSFTVTIAALDLSGLFARRRLRSDHQYAAIDALDYFHELWEDAILQDNSWGFEIESHGSATGVVLAPNVLTSQHMIAWNVMQNIANNAVDWAVVDRTLHLTVPGALSLGGLNDSDVDGKPAVYKRGDVVASVVGMRGAGAGSESGDAVFGETSDDDARRRVGLLDVVLNDDQLLTDDAARDSAGTWMRLVNRSPTQVDVVRLSTRSQRRFTDLVPGGHFDVNITETVLPVAGPYKLTAVTVDSSQHPGPVLTLQPLEDPEAAANLEN